MIDKGMIRQYLTLAIVISIALFVVTQLEWGGMSVQPLSQGDTLSAVNSVNNARSSQDSISTGDLRSGGISRSTPRAMTQNPLSPRMTRQQYQSASSTSLIGATSSPFQRGGRTPPGYDGVNNQFSGVPAKAGYPVAVESRLIEAASTPPATEFPETPENSHPELSTDVVISGHIVNDFGKPIEGLPLTLLLSQANEQDKKSFGTQTLNARSDAEGSYSFVNLVEGEYRVCTVESKGYKASCLSPRAPHSSVDFSLTSLSGGRVYGVVKDEQGTPLSDVSVSAAPGQRARAASDKKGRYDLTLSVSAGLNYQVYFTRDEYTRERISVKGSDLLAGKKLNITLKKTSLGGFDVVGTLYDQSGTPVRGKTVTLRSPTIKAEIVLRAISDASGEFTIKNVLAADDYRLNVSTGAEYQFDAAPYAKLKIFDGMSPLQLELQSSSMSSFSARVLTTDGMAIEGETFSLYSGSSFVGRATSDPGGEIQYERVPVKSGGSSLRVSGGSSPQYSFSGIKLVEGEHKSGVELLVDRGRNNLVVTVLDANNTPLAGAQGVLTWSSVRNGVRNQTIRSRGKTSIEGSGIINFSELGMGEHRLQLRMAGFLPQQVSIDISQQTQYEEVVLKKDVEQ